MKLLCVIPSYWPAFQYGGPIASVHGLNKALAKKGVDVTVYTTNVGLHGKVPVNREVNVDGVKVFYFRFSKLFEFMGTTGWQFSWQMTKALKRNLRAFDLIYLSAVWNYPTAAAACCSRRYKKPYVIAPRGVLYPYTAGRKTWKKRPYYELIVRRDLKNAVAIHYTTKAEAEQCHPRLHLRNRTIIIPNGIDLTEFVDLPGKRRLRGRYPVLKDKRVLLFLSRINWKKGLDLLAKAYGRLARERDDVHLLVVGPDEAGYKRKVIGWLKDEEALDRVTFTGMLTGDEKLAAYVGSDLFVLPSYSENFGMVVIEAMACGLPVVISDQVGVYKEVQRARAGVVVPPDSADLYTALVKLLDNKGESQEMGWRGKAVVEEQFAVEKVADRMIEAFEEILNGES